MSSGLARRYRSDVSVFSAVPDEPADVWSDLAPLAGPDGVVVVFRAVPMTAPPGWDVVFAGVGHQLVLGSTPTGVPDLPAADRATGERVTFRPLADEDVDDMVALVALTEPGPFRPRTIELGGYVGIWHGDRLVAMAGQRVRPPGYCEISAVCTHPDARRRGYASIVTARVAETITARGETPYLHVASTNPTAQTVYEQLGFVLRRTVGFAAFRVPPGDSSTGGSRQ